MFTEVTETEDFDLVNYGRSVIWQQYLLSIVIFPLKILHLHYFKLKVSLVINQYKINHNVCNAIFILKYCKVKIESNHLQKSNL